MQYVIERVGKLHTAGRPNHQRWRVKYWVVGNPKYKTKYFGPSEGLEQLSRRAAERLLARWMQEVGKSPNKEANVLLPTLRQHIDHYFESAGKRCNPDVQAFIRSSCKKLTTFFDEHRRVDSITPTDADRFLAYLQDSGLADASIRSNINNIKTIFRLAAKDYPGQISDNPFGHIHVKVKPKKGTWRYVSHDETLRALEACPSRARANKLGWQVFLALCRFAGLRAFSEALKLEKNDVDLTQTPAIIKVYSSKTARQSGTPSRIVPVLYPTLEHLLIRAISESSPGDPFVVACNVPRRRGDAHRTLKKILERADLVDDDGRPLWRPGFQILRACCERDFLNLGLSEYRYCRAIGHSPAVSQAHYLAKFDDAMVSEEDSREYQAAAQRLETLLADKS